MAGFQLTLNGRIWVTPEAPEEPFELGNDVRCTVFDSSSAPPSQVPDGNYAVTNRIVNEFGKRMQTKLEHDSGAVRLHRPDS